MDRSRMTGEIANPAGQSGKPLGTKPRLRVPKPVLWTALVGGAGLVAALVFSTTSTTTVEAQGAGASQPPPSVVVAPVTSEEVGATDRFIGRVQAIQSVNLTARVEGFLDSVNFTEGGLVKSGELMYQIETASYEAAVAQAQAEVAAANAAIAGAKASLTNAQTNLDRQNELVQRGTVSQAVADDATAQRDLAAANVQSGEAQLKQAEAQLQTAQLNLSYTKITSPIDGRIGATNVTKGNLVNAASGTLATIVQVDPMRVAFSIPETLYVQFAQTHDPSIRDNPNGTFSPSLELPTGEAYDQPGTIAFASNQIDPATGTLVIYADFPNPKAVLMPGAFVNVTVQEGQKQTMPIAPAPAILQDREGRYVFVLDQDDRAEQRRITTGPRVASGYAVSSGLQAGETVIVAGVQKVRPGEVVSPTTQPTSPATPAADGTATSQPASARATGGAPAAAPATDAGGDAARTGDSTTATPPATGSGGGGGGSAAATGGAPATASN